MARRKNNSGFSLVEIILVVALITIIAGISVPIYRSFQVDQELDVAAKDLQQNLRDAQNRSRSGQDDSAWGVHFSGSGDEYGVFKGVVYSSYWDDPVTVPSVLSVSTNFGTDIYFAKILGAPSTSGIITIEGEGGDIKQIEISEVGLINLN